MLTLEITSIDLGMAHRVSKKVERFLKEYGANVKLVEPADCLLGQALRIINTYSAIPVDKNSRIFLDTAREHQNYIENIEPHEKEDILIIKNNSYISEMFYNVKRYDAKKIIVRHLIKKMAKAPDALVFLSVDLKDYLSKKKKFNSKYRAEQNLKGTGGTSRHRKYPDILKKISDKYGTKTCIIKVGENAEDSAAREIVNFLEENNIIKFAKKEQDV